MSANGPFRTLSAFLTRDGVKNFGLKRTQSWKKTPRESGKERNQLHRIECFSLALWLCLGHS